MDSGVARPQVASGSRNGLVAGLLARTTAAVSGAVGALAGAAPHVLHHVGPLAGAALLTGVGGTVLFGVAGFALTIPMLLRIRRRFRSWAAPGVALVLFAALFTASTVWIGPVIRGDGGSNEQPSDHDAHHP